MVRGLYVAASGITLQIKKNDVHAANLANVSTAGYRRNRMTQQAFALPQASSGHLGDFEAPLLTAPTGALVDLSPGRIIQTGNDLDLAVSGRGLFCVQTPNGEAYTANGQFQLNNQSVLVDGNGNPLLGQQGPMRVAGGEVRVTEDGEVFVGDRRVDQLRIIELTDPGSVQKLAGGLLVGGDAAPAQDFRVIQGARQGSNVQAVQELQRMMAGMRQYEANVRTLQTQDDTISTLLREAVG